MTDKTAEELHRAFTLGYYGRMKKLDIQAVISAHGDAAHMCDSIAADIRRENTVKSGKKTGKVTNSGEEMARAVERAGAAIWAMHEELRENYLNRAEPSGEEKSD